MNIEHGSGKSGEHIAVVIGSRLTLIVEQTPVPFFEVGDKIGWEGGTDLWAGTIVISEPDHSQTLHGWHLAWKNQADPAKTFHWRGRQTSRDTRWYPRDQFVILELP